MEKKLRYMVIEMPERFGSLEDYLSKIQEFMQAEAKVNKLKSMQKFSAAYIDFKQTFSTDVTCKLEMLVPKEFINDIHKGFVLQVYIPVLTEKAKDEHFYTARGYVQQITPLVD